MTKININNKEYPQILKKIKNPPINLYCKGNIELLKEKGIAIVGSRNCTEYGKRMTKKFVKQLSDYGLTIISGMALGVDSIAHTTTLDIHGKTIAVLPCGFDNIYPKQNKKLYSNILENDGLIVTEYESYEVAESQKFLERNRIVAGLAIATLVIEGGYRSGTSVTAKLTKEMNRKVFCVPSSVENPKGFITNQLIKEGNILVTNGKDIICEYPELKLENKANKTEDLSVYVPEECREIYKIITENPIYIDEIYKKAKIEINELNYKLTILELQGYIQSLPGKNYMRKLY